MYKRKRRVVDEGTDTCTVRKRTSGDAKMSCVDAVGGRKRCSKREGIYTKRQIEQMNKGKGIYLLLCVL